MVKNPAVMQEICVRSLGQQDPLEEGMETHSSILAWRIPMTEEPGGLQSMGSQRVWHDWASMHEAQVPGCERIERKNIWWHVVLNMLIQQIIFKYSQFKLFFSFRFQNKGAFSQRKSTCNYKYTLTNCILKASENRLEHQSTSIPQFAKDTNNYVWKWER